MSDLKKYLSGPDTECFDLFYVYPEYDPAKKRPDFLFVIEKTGKNDKKIKVIESPEINYFMVKKEHVPPFPAMLLEENKMDMVTCSFNNRLLDQAKRMGKGDEFWEMSKAGMKYQFGKKLQEDPKLMLADIDINTFYKIFRYNNENHYPITRSFMDIEVDIYDYKGGVPPEDTAPCPVSMISHYDDEASHLYMLGLTNPRKTQQHDFHKDYLTRGESIEEILEIKREFPFVKSVSYDVFTDEKLLLKYYFGIVHKTKPDMCAIWNMRFDIKTILNRLLRYYTTSELPDVLCHPDIENRHRYVKWRDDDDQNKEFHEKMHEFYVSGYTKWVDLMAIFSDNRKVSGKMDSYRLDDVAKAVVGIGKVEMPEGVRFKQLEYKDYRTFFRYSARDTLIMRCIDVGGYQKPDGTLSKGTGELESFAIAAKTTDMYKSKKVTKDIYSDLVDFWYKRGFVIGNTIDCDYPGGVREGGIVAASANIRRLGMTI